MGNNRVPGPPYPFFKTKSLPHVSRRRYQGSAADTAGRLPCPHIFNCPPFGPLHSIAITHRTPPCREGAGLGGAVKGHGREKAGPPRRRAGRGSLKVGWRGAGWPRGTRRGPPRVHGQIPFDYSVWPFGQTFHNAALAAQTRVWHAQCPSRPATPALQRVDPQHSVREERLLCRGVGDTPFLQSTSTCACNRVRLLSARERKKWRNSYPATR